MTQQWLKNRPFILMALLAMALYGRSLAFGFWNDDPTGNFAWMQSRTTWQLFTTSAGYGFYRPVGFLLWQVIATLFGFVPALFHALSLLVHGLNVFLLALLLHRWSKSMLYTLTAVTLFALCPFHYEAVAYVAALFHPLLLLWLLLTLWLYAHHYHKLAHLTLVLGLFTHENGLLIPALLVLMVWWLEPTPPTRPTLLATLRQLWPMFIAPVLFLALWFAIPKSGQQTIPTWTQISHNALAFSQTAVYPLLPLLKLTASNGRSLWLATLGFLLLTYLTSRHSRTATTLWFSGVLWLALGSLPSLLFLSTGYVYGSPRLQYLPSVGIALLWATPTLWLIALSPKNALRYLPAALTTLLLVLTAWSPLRFISCELDFYAITSTILRTLANQTNNGRSPITVINLPFFFSSTQQHPDGCPNPYPWTPTGSVIMPQYANVRDFIRLNGGANVPATAITVAEYAPGWNTVGETRPLASLRQAILQEHVLVFDLPQETWRDLTAVLQHPTVPQTYVYARYSQISLTDAQYATVQTHELHQATVKLTWRLDILPQTTPKVFVHLLTPDGRLLGQSDTLLGQGLIGPELWQTGDTLSETYRIPIPPDNHDIIHVGIGLYDPLTGLRWPAEADNHTPLPDNMLIIQHQN